MIYALRIFGKKKELKLTFVGCATVIVKWGGKVWNRGDIERHLSKTEFHVFEAQEKKGWNTEMHTNLSVKRRNLTSLSSFNRTLFSFSLRL